MPTCQPMPWKFMAEPPKLTSLPFHESVRLLVQSASRLAMGATSSRSQLGSTRMSVFRNTSTSPWLASTPTLMPPAKPWFWRHWIVRASGALRSSHCTEPSTEPLSTTTISSSSAG
jgi:hypothetical protein